MKILAFVDIHGSLGAIKKLKQRVKKENPDLIICAGDMTIFEHKFFDILKRINKLGKEVLIVHGNHEEWEVLSHYSKLLKNITCIHKKIYKKEDFIFIGYGGGGFAIKDAKFDKWIKSKYKKLKDKKIVFITHGPSYKSGIDKIHSEEVGNKSYKKFIDKTKPVLVVAGHLHENSNKKFRIKGITYINPGPSGKVLNI